tara:strand:+ start:418 stop:660 length:243 start_codon:yes stop_codon:yes gene_type:complete
MKKVFRKLINLLITLLSYFASFFLTFVYFLIITPLSLFLKLFGYDPLNFKFNNKYSYRIISTRDEGGYKKNKEDLNNKNI